MSYHVDDDIRRAETLPADAFTSQRFLEAELATVFRRSWLVVPERGDDPRPLDEQLAPRGSRVPITVNGRPLFLQRGWDDDELRAFPNTCTHAWYPLVLGASRGPTLVCGQHGRRFDCTGRYLSQQGFGNDLPGFSVAQNLEKMGMLSSDTGELAFEDFRVPADSVLGQVGKGFYHISWELQSERLVAAAGSNASADSEAFRSARSPRAWRESSSA